MLMASQENHPQRNSTLAAINSRLAEESAGLRDDKVLCVADSKFLKNMADPDFRNELSELYAGKGATPAARNDRKWLAEHLSASAEHWTVAELREIAERLIRFGELELKSARDEVREYHQCICDCSCTVLPGEVEACEKRARVASSHARKLAYVAFEIYLDLRLLAEVESAQGDETLKVPVRCADTKMALCHPLVVKARGSAEQDFSGHTRKVPKGCKFEARPYFDHLERVTQILAEVSDNVDLLAAAYLHDHLEDLTEKWNRKELARCFSAEVATLVDWVTQPQKGISWEIRNDRYIKRLAGAPVEALMLSAADKISNMEDLISWMSKGYQVGSVIKYGWKVNTEKFHALAKLFDGKIPEALYRRYERTLKAFDELGRGWD